MPEQSYPLLLFPTPATADRKRLPDGGGKFTRPSGAKQGERLTPRFSTLQAAFNAERLRLQHDAPAENPELVIVFETIGTVENFAKAVAKVAGLEWLFETALDSVAPDEDFYVQDKPEKMLSGRLFLLGTNQQALTEILSLWDRFKNDPGVQFKRGLAPWKHVFEQLKDVRRWSVQDRIGADVRLYWHEEVSAGPQSIRFEIEAWCLRAADRNEQVRAQIETLVQGEGGRIVGRTLLPDIAYHGFLVDLPIAAIEAILRGGQPGIVLSDRIMYFRPRAQSIIAQEVTGEATAAPDIAGKVAGAPVIALLDGLPLQNHALLAG